MAALGSLPTNTGGTTQLGFAGTPITVNTTGLQTYSDAVTLLSDTTLVSSTTGGATTTANGLGNGNITLANTVDGAFALAVNTAGTTALGGAVGGVGTPLVSLTTNSGGRTTITGRP